MCSHWVRAWTLHGTCYLLAAGCACGSVVLDSSDGARGPSSVPITHTERRIGCNSISGDLKPSSGL